MRIKLRKPIFVVDAIDRISQELRDEYDNKTKVFLEELQETETHFIFTYRELIGEDQ